MKELFIIQSKLRAPKNLKNEFGKYKYRSCETILEALKPLLKETETILLLNDELVLIGSRYYIKSTATLIKEEKSVSSVGYAREEETKKGMDGSQITGASSSYARKYALNGLFAIDDGVDSDKTNKHGKEEEKQTLKTSKNNFCPTCGIEGKIKEGTTKTGKPYKLVDCDCGTRYFIN